jgi:hypothetical protein
MNSWGSGMFTGGITVFGTGLTRDATTTDGIHVTGMVSGYGFGFGLYFSTCSDLSKYTGVSFKVKGTTDTTAMLQFQLETNTDYPWQPRPTDMKGGCTATGTTDPYSICIAPSKLVGVTATATTVMVAFADLAGGMPTAGAPASDLKGIVGMQWALPWSGVTEMAYAADVTVSDVTLIGGTGISCVGAGGTGGAGGAGAGGATAGGGGTGGA